LKIDRIVSSARRAGHTLALLKSACGLKRISAMRVTLVVTT